MMENLPLPDFDLVFSASSINPNSGCDCVWTCFYRPSRDPLCLTIRIKAVSASPSSSASSCVCGGVAACGGLSLRLASPLLVSPLLSWVCRSEPSVCSELEASSLQALGWWHLAGAPATVSLDDLPQPVALALFCRHLISCCVAMEAAADQVSLVYPVLCGLQPQRHYWPYRHFLNAVTTVPHTTLAPGSLHV
eukprot:TRINITY_DN604_c0_g2_i2.p1 TRINITY_DN604_c0_g2~~TRINITY_DN604_c0_g2_i2.p1  ORF type:complete len:193 (+),score=39.68 TRINITY_DN604_c0_g2_i2:91-669(+)